MTTPAENAATVREALGWVETLPEGQFSGEAEAALAALLAQAEAAEILQDKLDVEREVHAEVEAERDAAVRTAEQAQEALREAHAIALNGDDHRIADPLARLDAIESVARAALTGEGTE